MVERRGQLSSTPLSRTSRVGFIGAGRLGSSLALAMIRAEYKVVALSTGRADHGEWLRSHMPEVSVHSQPEEVAEKSDIVFIATSDSAIRQVCESIEWRDNHYLAHGSGAVTLRSLDSAASAGAVAGGFHPLQTFPNADSADSLRGVTFGIESPDEQFLGWLSSLAEDLGGRAYPLTADQRPAYHAAAVMACGLLAGLTGLAAEIWASAGGISRDEALVSLVPLVKTTANSMAINGLPNALTGPYVRGDVETVEAHIAASSAHSPELGAAYAALANAALHIAREQGNLTPEAESSIKGMLKAALQSNCEILDKA